ncbi:hypothetical protein [Vibrio variabilis]|uniref:hypothetical protein n=1 Tax=Vibrio variabilis TaxID=990271 RepID=UPI000DD50520|nr:hypothetical protein [Vibrio variabilis]
MNRRIFITAIRIVPKRLQSKALGKALNFLFTENPIKVDDGTTLAIKLEEIKDPWHFVSEGHKLSAISKAPVCSDISVESNLDTVLSLQTKEELNNAIVNNQISISGHNKAALLSAISELRQQTMDDLVNSGYRFLRLKQPPRLDIHAVSFADVRNQQDVDFLRDEAIRLENKDIRLALKLMEIAHKARPNGPVISQKVQQYRQKVSSL